VRRFLRAYVEGSHYNLTNAKGAQKILQKYLAIKDEKSVEEAYNEIVVKLTRRVPYPTEPGIQLFLDQLKAKNPKAGQAKPSDFTDVSFLKELESSGYIDKLYK
jgi:ABC-type nitrate/sulfonate/bicarbonate transport system substrate-binding protein